ncbi:RHS repeat-associated core domain-containing protein, partial [Thauera sinica]
RARYYDPGRGRFISEDPLGFAAGDVNFYAYVGNNPVNYTDPSGEVAVVGMIYGGIAGGVGGAISGYASEGWSGAAKGFGTGFVVGAGVGAVTPWLSHQVGATAATLLVGGASSAAGQLSGNVVTGQTPGTNFSWGAVAGSATGNVLASVPAKLVGNAAATSVGTSVTWGSRSLTIVTPTVQHTGSTFRALTEGAIGGTFEAGGQAIENMLFPTPPAGDASSGSQTLQSFQQLSASQGAAGGFLLYPNKSNTNMMQSVYVK